MRCIKLYMYKYIDIVSLSLPEWGAAKYTPKANIHDHMNQIKKTDPQSWLRFNPSTSSTWCVWVTHKYINLVYCPTKPLLSMCNYRARRPARDLQRFIWEFKQLIGIRVCVLGIQCFFMFFYL